VLALGGVLGYFASTISITTNAHAQADASAGKEDRAADRAAIRDAMKGFSAAFHKGDASGAAAFLTSEAELIPVLAAEVPRTK
jgi:hypothetical protein